jgi:hypothetical protein
MIFIDKEDSMARRKSISFDAMVKFFIRNYGIPTKQDVDKLMSRIDKLESLIKSSAVTVSQGQVTKKRGPAAKSGRSVAGMTASDTVLNIVKKHRAGIGFAAIQEKSGFDEKKLRNIIFRLNKLGIITRKARGTYLAS